MIPLSVVFNRFVSRVEEVLNDWKLIRNNASKPPEKVTTNPHSIRPYYINHTLISSHPVSLLNELMDFLIAHLIQGEYTSGTWEEKTQDINFADFKFSVTHHCLKQESEEGEGKEEPEEGTLLLRLLFIIPVIISVS